MIGTFFVVSETIHHKKIDDLDCHSRKEKAWAVAKEINPVRVLVLFKYPNLLLVALASAALVWNMYGLLTPIRYVLNPRFELETPILGGLFYLAPGFGYIAGSFVGGRWADRTVRQWIKKRGKRVPEDRLRSALPFLGIVMPGSALVYGWTVDQAVGGIPVPVIAMFVQGVGQLFCFPSLNTYCLDVMAGQGAEVAAGNYFLRYLAGCLAIAVVLPAIEAMGVGWFSTLSTVLMLLSTVGIVASIKHGQEWQKKVKAGEKAKRKVSDQTVSTTDGAVQGDGAETTEKEETDGARDATKKEPA